jgi:hypothetical protein
VYYGSFVHVDAFWADIMDAGSENRSVPLVVLRPPCMLLQILGRPRRPQKLFKHSNFHRARTTTRMTTKCFLLTTTTPCSVHADCKLRGHHFQNLVGSNILSAKRKSERTEQKDDIKRLRYTQQTMPAITKASIRKTRVGVSTDKSLLRVLLFATGVISLAVILVPLTLDDDSIVLEIPLHKITTLASKADNVNLQPPPKLQPKVDATIQELSKVGVESIPRKEEDATHATKDSYHTVFSTGCSTFQDWQSYVFFYHLLHSGQEGPVTRIASGCSDEDAQTLQEIFEKEIAVMAPGRFRLHFTPDFSHMKPGKNFKYVRRFVAGLSVVLS